MAGNGWASHTSLYMIGNDTLKWRGIAPKAMILEDRNDYYDANGQKGAADVNNHSFIGGDAYYSEKSAEADQALSIHDNTLPIQHKHCNNVGVYAAGNNGNRQTQSGTHQIGYYSLLQNNKNGIVVGAIESSIPITIAPLSSLGPTRDGRIKPDIVAPGDGLL